MISTCQALSDQRQKVLGDFMRLCKETKNKINFEEIIHQDRLTLFAVAFLLILASPHPSSCSSTYLVILATDQISSLGPRVVVGLCRLPTICLTQVCSTCGKDVQSPGSHVEGSP